jgi:hypothetical protein
MIAKTRKGSSFTGLIRYLTKGERGQVLSFHNLSSETPEEAASEMVVGAATSLRTRRPVLHTSVSYAKGESPSRTQMQDDATSVLKSLGLSENQAVVVAHDDRDHTHFHIAANRVGADAKAVSDSNSYAKIETTLRQIEADRGWTAVEGRHALTPGSGLRMTGPRKSKERYQINVPDGVRDALQKAESWSELHRDIRRSGWSLSVVQQGKGSGALLVGPGGEKIGAGAVDRSATLTQLRRRLGCDPVAKREMAMRTTRRELKRAARSTLVGVTSPFLSGGLMPLTRPSRKRRRKANPVCY